MKAQKYYGIKPIIKLEAEICIDKGIRFEVYPCKQDDNYAYIYIYASEAYAYEVCRAAAVAFDANIVTM